MNTSTIGRALFSKTQRALLALFFVNPDKSYYLREITRLADVGVGAVQRELAGWTEAGILIRTRRGMQVYYRANKLSPVFAELQTLTIKTVGVADYLKEALKPLHSRITTAYIYGSFARGTQKSGSDIDLMIVGRVSFREVIEALADAQTAISREINPTVYDTDDYCAKLRAKDHFLTSLTKEPKVWLIGADDESD